MQRGNLYYFYNGYEGILDEVAYYDTALDQSQVEAHYDAIFVPEPATIAMLGLGGLLLRRKRA